MDLTPVIIFEDQNILVVDKPSGMIVNRADTARKASTLQDWAEEKINITDKASEFANRGGIVHRLDRETSGLLIIAKNEEAFVNLQKQFKERTVQKTYVALVHGDVVNESGTIDSKIARVGSFGKFGVSDVGRESTTNYEVEERYILSEDKINELVVNNDLKLNKNRIKYLQQHGGKYTLLNVFPKTGRTHQIRVHMKSLGHPLVSDLIYGPSKLLKFDLLWCPRLFLHAKVLSFNHPTTNEKLSFEVSLPTEIEASLKFLH